MTGPYRESDPTDDTPRPPRISSEVREGIKIVAVSVAACIAGTLFAHGQSERAIAGDDARQGASE